MRYLSTLSLVSLCISSAVHADEYTVAEKPFKVETTLNAVFFPEKSQAISIQPEVWADFTITDLVPQGSVVKKGEPLITIDTRKLDELITATEKARKSDALKLAQAKQELAQLEVTTPRSLASYERSNKEAQDDLKWYTDIGHAQEIEATKRSVKRAELNLAYQLEELKQLEKMYAEDKKTEETEEIILTRTRNYVEQAQFALKSAKIDTKRSLETHIPRKLKSKQLAAEDAQLANSAAKENLPRALELKRLAVAKAIHSDGEAAKKLTRLKADREMMNITAPSDGIIYYGSLSKGKWNPTTAVKVLRVGGKLPAHTTLMSFIPQSSPLVLSAFTAENHLPVLKQGTKGQAITNLNRYTNFPVSLTEIASYPETDGSYRVSFSASTPKGLKIAPTMKATIRIVSDKKDKALKIPTAYLSRADDGSYTVKLKLADGKTEQRAVTPGASNKEFIVITKGLESGQVIVK